MIAGDALISHPIWTLLPAVHGARDTPSIEPELRLRLPRQLARCTI